jgi:hypothetical protein
MNKLVKIYKNDIVKKGHILTYNPCFNSIDLSASITESFYDSFWEKKPISKEESINILNSDIKSGLNEKISSHDKMSKKLNYKFFLIKNKLNFIPKDMKQKFNEYINSIEKSKNLIKKEYKEENLKEILKPLPEFFMIDEKLVLFLEKNLDFYVFNHSHSSYIESSVKKVLSIHHRLDYYNENLNINLTFNTGKSSFFVDKNNLNKFNGDYISTGTIGEYIFLDYEKCKKFAEQTLKEDISKLNKTIDKILKE